jgi:iron complex outermembrane receptor protein
MVLKRNILSVALMSATMMLAANAQAQSQQEQETRDKISKEEGKEAADPDAAKEIDKVVVTGLRSSIENSIATKRDNSQIVEAISAEDVGKLPDSSIADALARLPGLTAQRERGRATQIQIRGFAGDFSTTLLNGREQASTGDNRAAEFDQYPSELLSQVVVYKTADASLVGQGLSGTVDLQTVNPLSYDDRVVQLSYRYDQNELDGNTESGNRFSFTYIDQFLDNTLGVSIGYAYQDSPQPGLQNEAWGYPGANVPGSPAVMGGAKVYKFDADFKRQGWAGSIQFKPNDFYETSFDLFYSTFDKTEIKTGIEFGTAWGQGILQPGYTVGSNNTITNSDWTNVKPVIRNDSNPQDNTTQSYGWNNIFTFNEDWKMIVDLATSKADSDFTYLETYAGFKSATPGQAGVTDLSVDLRGDYNNFTFGRDFGNPADLQLIDAGGWGQDGYIKEFKVEDQVDAYRLDFIRSFADGGVSSIEFGVNYTDRTKSKGVDEAFLCINADITNGCGRGYASAPYPGTSQPFDFSGITNVASYDAESLYNSGFYTRKGNPNKDISNKNWEVDETVTTWYGQLNLDAEFGSVRMTGNIGVQYQQTDQSANGFATFQGNPNGDSITGGAKYGNFLPSLNLNFNVFEDQYLRVAVAEQLARPRMDAMRANYDVSITNNQGTVANPLYVCNGIQTTVPIWCGGGGNPEIEPWLATAYDVSYEWYFTSDNDNKGYVSAALFYKALDTFIYYSNSIYDFSNEPLPPPQPGDPSSTIGILNQPNNGEGGYMRGYELTASLPLDVLWSPLNGFGILATYASNSSNVNIPNPDGTPNNQPLTGLSEEVYNASLYWERFGWQVRYNYRYRSDFRGETRGFGADLAVIDISAETVQDAQIQYTFGSGFAENLTLYLQVNNLGDEPFRSDAGVNRPIAYFEYGRTTLLGFSYKF